MCTSVFSLELLFSVTFFLDGIFEPLFQFKSLMKYETIYQMIGVHIAYYMTTSPASSMNEKEGRRETRMEMQKKIHLGMQ